MQHCHHTLLPNVSQWLQQRVAGVEFFGCESALKQKRCFGLSLRTATICQSATDGAHALLKDFTKQEARGAAQSYLGTRESREKLREAMQAAMTEPWPAANFDPAAQPPQVLIGVVSSDIRLAVRSLRDYTAALKLPFVAPESRVPGVSALPAIRSPVYIKYNAASRSAYATAYSGPDRGVLVSLGQEQIGHLPLGLFDEDKKASHPTL